MYRNAQNLGRREELWEEKEAWKIGGWWVGVGVGVGRWCLANHAGFKVAKKAKHLGRMNVALATMSCELMLSPWLLSHAQRGGGLSWLADLSLTPKERNSKALCPHCQALLWPAWDLSPFPTALPQSCAELWVYFFRWVNSVSNTSFSVAFN